MKNPILGDGREKMVGTFLASLAGIREGDGPKVAMIDKLASRKSLPPFP